MNTEELEKAIEERSKNVWWLFGLFLLASTPGIFNSMHLTSYVFLSDTSKFWCNIPLLQNANWTEQQIKNISALDPQAKENCLMYDWNYTYFKQIGYTKSLEYIQDNTKPVPIKCGKYAYEEEKPSIVSEWDLVCEYTALKSVAQVAVALGKFIGAFMFGIFADKFGRKKCFAISCFIYIFSGPIAGFAQDYYLFLIMRVLLGIAGSGVYEAGYTIITESTVKDNRTRLGCLYNISYSIGLIILPFLAYFSYNWRQLQYYLSFPAIVLLIHSWFIPESPRWLIAQGRIEEAKRIIYGKNHVEVRSERTVKNEGIQGENINNDVSARNHPWYKKLFSAVQKLSKIYTTRELRKRILICYFGWFVASMSYFVIALNANNFSANKYIYVLLNGVVEAPGYILPLVVLAFIGRKLTGVLLFSIAGVALVIILFIQNSLVIMSIALLGRLCMSAVFAVIILHTSELFPTSNRNSAIGTSLTMAQLGAIVAPFIVDILGNIAWYIPSTLCGVVSVVAGLLILFLPETNNRPLMDKLEDVHCISDKDEVSCTNCFKFS